MVQKLIKKHAANALILCVIAICYSACKKTNTKPTENSIPVTISSISVNSGPVNTVVVITGTSFDTTPSNNKVFFNGKAATVSAATTTQLTVAVPLGAGTGNITLSVKNATAISGPVFTYQPSAVVTTLAGNINGPGAANGTGTSASFNIPTGIAVDAAGNVYVGDGGNCLIRKITPAGVVTTLAGSGANHWANGTGTSASFSIPTGVAVDAAGNVYVADGLIRKISATGVVTNLSGSSEIVLPTSDNFPYGIALDATGNLYAADTRYSLIRKITVSNVVTTFAKSPDWKTQNGSFTIGGVTTLTYDPFNVAVDAAGNVYVAEYNRGRIWKVTPAGEITAFAGAGYSGSADGNGTLASFNCPMGLATDAAGNVYVADSGNNRIRKITPDGTVTTLAGSGFWGSEDGIGTSASFFRPVGVAVNAAGNVLYVADGRNNLIRKITLQ